MKKLLSLVLLTAFFVGNAQETANRFFYELTFKPKKEAETTEKVMTVLDITKDKSLFRDFTTIAQDSLLKAEIETMQKTGVYKDISKSMKMPKFAFKVTKKYPEMTIQYSEGMLNGMTPVQLAYNDNPKFDWKIINEKTKIGEYNVQKATADFGGRKWTAWFSADIPFQDNLYKFYGLPWPYCKS
ncbi:GLPGLI family protein [Kaistella anthropi]|nr:GLPGLI family protein [Kaistella anthropi]